MDPTSSPLAPRVTQTNKIPEQRAASSRASNRRYSCDINGCSSTFTRLFDMGRHKRTIHGPKGQCQRPGCSYTTARSDKMNEHIRKKHAAFEATMYSERKSQHFPQHFGNLDSVHDSDILDNEYLGPEASIHNLEGPGPELSQPSDLEYEPDPGFGIEGYRLTNALYSMSDSEAHMYEGVIEPFSEWEPYGPDFETYHISTIGHPDVTYGTSDPSSEVGNAQVTDPGQADFPIGRLSLKIRDH